VHSKPLVSVIVIFLNMEKFIQEAIDSVFDQIYDNWELLLVDDGSTDGSSQIALRCAEHYPGKVRYFEHACHENLGMSSSRNLGIRNAKGKYIAFLDADDVWLVHKLDQQVAILNSQPEAAMVYGAIELWHSWTKNPEDLQRDSLQKIGTEPNTLIRPPSLLSRFLGRKAITPCPSDVLVRREIVDGVGGFEESFRNLYEDQVFFAKVCLKAPVFVASECWDRHRQHPDSSSSLGRRTGEVHSFRPIFLSWVEQYLSQQGFKDTEVWNVVQRELWPYRHPTVSRLLGRARHPTREMKELLKWIARRTLPISIRHWLRVQWQSGEMNSPAANRP